MLCGCRELILTRAHTVAAPKHHIDNGGKAWDTVKPLNRWFKDLSRVVIVDDDAFKVGSHQGSETRDLCSWAVLLAFTFRESSLCHRINAPRPLLDYRNHV